MPGLSRVTYGPKCGATSVVDGVILRGDMWWTGRRWRSVCAIGAVVSRSPAAMLTSPHSILSSPHRPHGSTPGNEGPSIEEVSSAGSVLVEYGLAFLEEGEHSLHTVGCANGGVYATAFGGQEIVEGLILGIVE